MLETKGCESQAWFRRHMALEAVDLLTTFSSSQALGHVKEAASCLQYIEEVGVEWT